MSTTAAKVIVDTLRLFGILDQTEDASQADTANNVVILNNMLRSEMADGASQFLMKTENVTLPAGVSGQIYRFSIGTADPAYLFQRDAVGVKAIWMGDIGPTINRETRMAPKADVVRTTYPGILTKWHQERQADGSVLITAWQPPRASAVALVEYGARLAPLTAADGSDVVALPPEGIMDAELLLGLTICGSYGRPITRIDPVLAQRAQAVDKRWRDYSHGTQWSRFVRS